MKKSILAYYLTISIFSILILPSCNNDENHHRSKIDTISDDTINSIEVSTSMSATDFSPYVKVFVENSGSMFGYVRDYNDFSKVESDYNTCATCLLKPGDC